MAFRCGSKQPSQREAEVDLPPYRWILFDADGTLFDYDRAEVAALAALWTDADLGRSHAELRTAYRRINGALWKRFENGDISSHSIKEERFRRLVEELRLDADPAELSHLYLGWLGRQIQLLPGAERLLESLAPTYRLALITNGLASVQRSRLERSPIGRHFEVVVISEEVGFAKPDPRIFEHAFTLMGGPAKPDVLMVGDNLLADIDGAGRYGLETCWVNLDGRATNGKIATTHEAHRLSDLEEILVKS